MNHSRPVMPLKLVMNTIQDRNGHIVAQVFDYETGKLIVHAANSFDSAAKKMAINAAEFADRMQEGGLVKFIEALVAAEEYLESGKLEGPGKAKVLSKISAAINSVGGGVT